MSCPSFSVIVFLFAFKICGEEKERGKNGGVCCVPSLELLFVPTSVGAKQEHHSATIAVISHLNCVVLSCKECKLLI